MKRLIWLVLAIPIAVVVPARALDCTGPTGLECGVTSNGVVIGSGAVPADPDWCNNSFSSNTFAHIFEFTSTTTQEITASSTSPLINLFLLNSCDQDDCVPNATGQGTPTVTACLSSGTYLVAATTVADAIFSYSVGLTCNGCTTLDVDSVSWPILKRRYR